MADSKDHPRDQPKVADEQKQAPTSPLAPSSELEGAVKMVNLTPASAPEPATSASEHTIKTAPDASESAPHTVEPATFSATVTVPGASESQPLPPSSPSDLDPPAADTPPLLSSAPETPPRPQSPKGKERAITPPPAGDDQPRGRNQDQDQDQSQNQERDPDHNDCGLDHDLDHDHDNNDAIGPAQEGPVLSGTPLLNDDGVVCQITLLVMSGNRHPYRIDEKYLEKRKVAVPDRTDSGRLNPFSISVYTLKELILRDWRSDWEAKPASPSSIRLIHFGKLLDDKDQLRQYNFSSLTPNIVHMTIRPADVAEEEEPKQGGKPAHSTGANASDPRCCCVVL